MPLSVPFQKTSTLPSGRPTARGAPPSGPTLSGCLLSQVVPLNRLCHRSLSVPFQNTSTTPLPDTAAVGGDPIGLASVNRSGPNRVVPTFHAWPNEPSDSRQNASTTPS